MERVQQNKPWALLFILFGVAMFLLAWTSYTFILRILVTIGAFVAVDYGMGLLGMPTLSQLINRLFTNFTHKS